MSKRAPGPTIVKKYANRRLYDTSRSSYVTLEDLCEMVKEEHEFVVQDAKSGEDLTRAVLTQIIAEQETKENKSLLPVQFLRQLIKFYDHHFQHLVPGFLEQSLNALVEQQDKVRDQMTKSTSKIGAVFPGLQVLEDIQKKNVALFENAMRAMTPFPLRNMAVKGASAGASPAQGGAAARPPATRHERISAVRRNIAALQRELDQLQK